MTLDENLTKYLQPTAFIDSDSPDVRQFVEEVIDPNASQFENIITLYYKVRDAIAYKIYDLELDRDFLKASSVLEAKKGFCIQKSILMAAVARCIGVPSRLGFADVRNHLTSDRLKAMMTTDVFTWHGYTDLYLEGQWVKATPAFNIQLCQATGVKPLEFDGRNDSIFHESNEKGQKHMEYIHYRGTYADLPYEEILDSIQTDYPFLINGNKFGVTGSLIEEAGRPN